jgi:hypothetical protein
MAIVRNNNLAKSAKFFDSEGALNVIEGSNVTITTDNTAGTITIAATASSNIDSASVEAIVDSSYIQARQITYSTADFLDSARAEAIIDSSYVQTRQDYAYSSLTGAPTNVSSFTNDAGYTTYDSTNAAGQIEAYAYSTYDSTNAAGQIEAYGYTTYDSTNFSQQLSAASGTSFDPVGTDNSTDVTLAGSYDYITISGQEITRNQVDATTDISNLTTSNVTEGTNLYYTTERADSDARAAINVSSTEPGALSYSQATGTLYYTGPNDTEIRGSFSGGTGVTITDLARLQLARMLVPQTVLHLVLLQPLVMLLLVAIYKLQAQQLRLIQKI